MIIKIFTIKALPQRADVRREKKIKIFFNDKFFRSPNSLGKGRKKMENKISQILKSDA